MATQRLLPRGQNPRVEASAKPSLAQWPFDGGDPVEAVGGWLELDESVREFWRALVRDVGEWSRDDGLVVLRALVGPPAA
jgi:hypothetical protein